MLAILVIIHCFRIHSLIQVTVDGPPCVKNMPWVGSRKSQVGTLWGIQGWCPSNREGAELSCLEGAWDVLGSVWGEGR